MNTSEHINEIAGALAKAQGEIQNPAKDSENPHFRNRYASLSGGLATIRAALSAHGLSFVQITDTDGDAMTLHTRLMHTSGQWIEGVYPICKVGKHQEMGAALTYAKRYSLFSLVGVAGDDEDTDGEGAAEAAGGKVKTWNGKAGANVRQAQDAATERARAEIVAYVDRCIASLPDIGSVDHLNTWWKAEGKTRAAYFSDKADPLYVRLYDAVTAHGDALKRDEIAHAEAAQ